MPENLVSFIAHALIVKEWSTEHLQRVVSGNTLWTLPITIVAFSRVSAVDAVLGK